MKWILALLFVLSTAHAQPIQQHNISDDGWAHVPLQFPFPLYGRVFTDSYMFSNGVVGFGSVSQGWCCTGFNLDTNRGYHLNFAIMPLQTDLINYGSGRFRTQGDSTFQRYMWENISEYGQPNNLNTFGLEIRPSGFIGMYYQQVNISAWRPVTSGVTGDTTLGEYQQFYHGNGFNRTNFEYTLSSTGNVCVSNPLSSPLCPGYQEAYDNLQCSQNPLYRPSCPGYAEAFHAQQCSLNALYSNTCPGYAVAYYNEQCRLNPLYDRQCPGYAEAYALANIVPATSTTVASANTSPTQPLVVAQPQVQVQISGEVAVTTPIVSDPVVNTVITTPTATARATAPAPQQQQTQQASSSSESSKKETDKPKQSNRSQSAQQAPKNDVAASGPALVEPKYEYKAPIILDPMYSRMIKRPIQDNGMALYHLLVTSNRKYEELIDGQWNRKGN